MEFFKIKSPRNRVNIFKAEGFGLIGSQGGSDELGFGFQPDRVLSHGFGAGLFEYGRPFGYSGSDEDFVNQHSRYEYNRFWEGYWEDIIKDAVEKNVSAYCLDVHQ